MFKDLKNCWECIIQVVCFTIPQLLETLPEKKLLSRSAEILKHSFVENWIGLIEVRGSFKNSSVELIKSQLK